MSVILPQQSRVQLFFRSAPSPCPYLPDRAERKLFTRLLPEEADRLNSDLTRAGFRRSHDIIYRPVCAGCSACVPVRIPVAGFAPNRTQRRILKRNEDLSVALVPLSATEEQYQLFRDYQQGRHAQSDMAQMTRLDFRSMVEDGSVSGAILELRAPHGGLIAAMLLDWLDDGASAVYSFFDPKESNRSLGTHLILATVDAVRARLTGGHVYLGYWIAESDKMGYKARFRGTERLGAQGWEPLNPDTQEDAHGHDRLR